MMQSLRLYRTFRLLLLGTMATNTAFWMYQVAVGWLALDLTDSPFFVGLAGFAGGIPLLIFGLPAGLIIDRYDRRTILMLAQLGVMAVAAAFAIFVATGIINKWSILVLVAIYGSIMAFIFPTRTAIVPNLVERADLANAVALNAAGQNATRVFGPTIAGVLIATLGVAETFAIAAVMQILALIATSRLPSIPSKVVAGAMSGWKSLTLGLHIVRNDAYLFSMVILALVPTVLVMPYLNLMPVFARDELGLGSSGLGMLLAATGLGTVAGALSVARSPRFRTWNRAQIVTAIAFAGLVLVFAMMEHMPLALIVLFFAGWVSAAFLAINQTAVQLRTDDEVRGRVMSVYLLTWGALPIGQLAVGAIASQFSTPVAIISSCLMALVCIGIFAWKTVAIDANAAQSALASVERRS
jgi:MFS family permease